MNGETANLGIIMTLRDQASRGIQKIDRGFAALSKRTEKLRVALGKVRDGLGKGLKIGAGIAAAGVAFLAVNVRAGIDSLAELEDVTKQTNATLLSTKGVAGLTATAIRKMSENLEDLTTVDDKAIQSAANLLLTFTNVRKDAFEPTLRAALDMAQALNMDVNSAVRSLGKALNDPIAGLSRLTRLGVTFTAQEKEKIKALVESGKTLEAQRLILGKLNRMYGGSAAAAADTYRGQQRRLADAVEGLQQALARALMPALTKVSKKITTFLRAPQVEAQITRIGDALAGLFTDTFTTEQITEGGQTATVVKKVASPWTTGLGLIKDAFEEIKKLPWEVIKGSLNTTLEVGRQALSIFQSLPPEVQAGLVTLLAANKVTGGALAGLGKIALEMALKAVTTIVAGNVTVIGKGVSLPGGGGGLPVPGPKGPGVGVPLVGAVAAFDFSAALSHIDAAFERVIAPQLRGNVIAEAGNSIQQRVSGFVGKAQEYAALQARLAPVQNDILNGIAADAQRNADAGKHTVSAVLTQSHQSAAQARALHAQQRLTTNAALRAIPLISGVRGAALATAQAVRAKDLSVTVRTSLNVSAREIASEVQRVTGNRGFVQS